MTDVKKLAVPVSSMSKIEMEEKIKSYKYVLFKLHQDIEKKDLEIVRLTQLLIQAQTRK